MARLFSSLRFKFALLLALFSGILMTAVMLLLEQNIRQALIRENIDKGIGIARGIAFNTEDPLLTGDDLYLFSAVTNALRSPGVRYALIVDREQRIRAADAVAEVGKPYTPPVGVTVEESGECRVVRTDQGEKGMLDLAVPILSLADRPIRLGEIHLGLSASLIAKEVAAMRNRLVVLAAVALVLGSLAAYFLAGFSIKPVQALVRGVKAIGEGNFEQHIALRRNDELGILTASFNEMANSLREKEYIKNTFERYVSKPLAREILKHKDELKLGGEEKIVTIVFSDLRGFTAMAEGMEPAQIVELLNAYFSRMIQVINRYEGMVDKLMGDEIMALFGAPLALGNDPLRAVQCALEMQQALTEFNAEVVCCGWPPLQMGIGINTGRVVAGNLGSASRMEYTVIGDNVNIASRLQGIAKAGEVLISETTFNLLRDALQVTPLEPVTLKGKRQPVAVYRVDMLQETKAALSQSA